jgi:hypothetical protein
MGLSDFLFELFTQKGLFPGSNVLVTQAAPNEPRSESAIVVDPSNPDRLLGASKRFLQPHNYVFSLGAVFSDDGGATWKDLPTFATPANHDVYTDPSATFDTAGDAWVMGDPGFHQAGSQQFADSLGCHGVEDIQTTHMLAQKSGDDGANWTPLPIFAPRCKDDDKGWLLCDNSLDVTISPYPHPKPYWASPYHGRLYAIWGANTNLRFARSLDGGQSWKGVGTQSAGADCGPYSYAPDISIGRNGTIHAFWHLPGTDSIQYLRSKDGGETFEGDGTIVNGFPNPRPLVTGLTDIHKGITNRVGSDPANMWPAFEGSNFRVLTIVASCCFGSNGVAIAWADAEGGHSRIYYRLSIDGGDTWVGPARGTPMLPNLVGDSHQFHPQLAATGSGVLGCAMYSYSKTARPGNQPGISVLVAGSFDEGATWEFKPITDQPWDPAISAPWAHGDSNVTFIGEYFGFDAGKSEFHVLWTDTRHGNQDLYYARVDTEQEKNWLPELVATYVSPGVSRDGGGFVIINGHIIRIPPWDPLRPILDVAVAIQTVSQVGTAKSVRAREMLYDLMIDIAKQAKKQLKE